MGVIPVLYHTLSWCLLHFLLSLPYTQCTSINDDNFFTWAHFERKLCGLFTRELKHSEHFVHYLPLTFWPSQNQFFLPSSSIIAIIWPVLMVLAGKPSANQQIRLCDSLRSFCPAPQKDSKDSASTVLDISVQARMIHKISGEGVNSSWDEFTCYVQISWWLIKMLLKALPLH